MLDRARVEARRRRPYLAIACVVAGLALSPAGIAPVAAASVVAVAAARLAFGGRASAIAAALVLVPALGGALRLAAIDRPAHAAPPGSAIVARATLLERPRAGLFGSSAPMRIDSGPSAGLRILARRKQFAWPAVDPGTQFAIRGFVKPDDPRRGSATGAAATAPGGAAPSEANAGKPGT